MVSVYDEESETPPISILKEKGAFCGFVSHLACWKRTQELQVCVATLAAHLVFFVLVICLRITMLV